jgi:beta-lactamase regulating signal transducer with metallopeptidase domain
VNSFLFSFLHFIVNTFFLFIATAGLVEFILWAFRIKNLRARTFLRLLPIIKAPLNFVLFKIFHYDYLFSRSMCICKKYLNKFINLFPQIDLQEFAISNEILLFSLLTISFAFLGFRFYKFIIFKKELRSIFSYSGPCDRKILNEKLRKKIDDLKVSIYVSDLASVPFVTLSSEIVIPNDLNQHLTQEEFEAVVAHEVEHVRWKDPQIKLFCFVISACCWWIPMNWWLKRIEQDQEEASDRGALRYGSKPLALGTAIVKAISRTKEFRKQKFYLCQMSTLNTLHIKRLKSLLNEETYPIFGCHTINCISAILITTIVLVSLWIC